MSEKENKNPFDGFKVLEGDTIAPTDVEIKDAPDVSGALAEDTGIVDKTDEPVDEVKEEVKKEKAEKPLTSDSLEIEYRETVDEDDLDEDDEETTAETKQGEDEVSQLGVLAKHLREEGVVEFDDEEFEDSEEGLVNVVKNQIKKGVDDYKEGLDPLAKQFLEYIEDGGDPQHFTKAYSTVDFSRITPENLKSRKELQKQLVAELMRKQGYEHGEILEEIQDLVSANVIAKRAARSLKKLQGIQNKDRADLLKQQKDANLKKEEEQSSFLSNLRNDIDGRENIAGFPISKKQKKAFYEYITKTDRKTGKTKLIADSENDKDSQLKMAWLYFNDFDFSKVEKKARTKATSNLRASLERAGNVSSRKLKSKTRTKSSGDDLDFSLFQKALR
tara:strand:- start:44619 stop:45785 length:1167 start_codon:yes stop_codon:yes gene_type:complete